MRIAPASGRELVAAGERRARDTGVHDPHLLTEMAADWFSRLGWAVVRLGEARSAVGASIEFTKACATTGVPMRRRLG